MPVNAPITNGNVWCVITGSAPSVSDSNYPLTTYWQNTTTNSFYCLTNNTAGSATWLLMRQNALVAKAWVNFTAAATPVVNASFNVGTVTRNSAGNYTISFTNAFNDVNYVPAIITALAGGQTAMAYWLVTLTTTSLRFITSGITVNAITGATNTPSDAGITTVVVYGDLFIL